jgi:hypothetical protein
MVFAQSGGISFVVRVGDCGSAVGERAEGERRPFEPWGRILSESDFLREVNRDFRAGTGFL